MKRTLLASLILSTSVLANAQSLPAPSPLGKVEQVVGLTTVKVEYSRPSAKGRVVFGSLVPFDKIWRTGANACTKVNFSGPVMFGGVAVPAGKYALVTIPNEGVWQVMLNSDTTISGADGYDEAKNVAMLKAEVKPMANATETFTIDLDAVKNDRAQLELRWEKTMVSIEIHADAMDQAMGNIKAAMSGAEVKAGTYHRSARFYLDRGIDNAQALAWAKQADSMEKKYWMKHTLALCYAANGMKKEAIATAKESMAMAETEKDDQYVKLNQEKIAEWAK